MTSGPCQGWTFYCGRLLYFSLEIVIVFPHEPSPCSILAAHHGAIHIRWEFDASHGIV